jgi:superfamily II DNA/RNA helicase
VDVFGIREQLIGDYCSFTSGFVDVRDRRIAEHVARELDEGAQWPDPWLSLNPSFAPGGTIDELVAEGVLHPECGRIFRIKERPDDATGRPLTLHRHQREALEVARSGLSYTLTTGTGSGKSLAYLVPIVDRVLREGSGSGVKAIVVYPMNALANSQRGELEKFLHYGYPDDRRPVTFARYTGQESQEEREEILKRPPDILLTNYVMLELVLTRPDERRRLIRAARGLCFLVLDELHTYRGRQGADVALLVRRVRDACESPDLQCIGTSATMASGGSVTEQQRVVAQVATRLFGAEVTPNRVIGETLQRATAASRPDRDALVAAVRTTSGERSYEELRSDPLARWIEDAFGLTAEEGTGRLVRRAPTTVSRASAQLAKLTLEPVEACADAIRATLHAGAHVNDLVTSRPLFAFRLHQFLSKGDTVYVSLEPEDMRHITSQYQQVVPGQPDKPLFPLAFCRECGQEYLVVARSTKDGVTIYATRRDLDASGGDEANGYLYVSADLPWPADPIQEGRLPDSWLEEVHGELGVVTSRRKRIPERVWLNADGIEAERGQGMAAAYVPSPFAFCLRCKVAYEQIRGKDFSKLATLDAEGRSSAMSVLAASAVSSLRAEAEGLSREQRKLLTFVDNRQDASLQAGHFNDFAQVTQLRGALYRAAAATAAGLTHEDVAQRVADALALPFGEFAQNPDAKFSARDAALRALREYLEYRIYLDLERGWRITMPNLEQVGLLKIGYADLAEIAADADCWTGTHQALRDAPGGLREELGRILLDEMRRVLAIQVDCLTPEGFERLQNMSRQHLMGPWSMPDREPQPDPGVAFARPAGRGGRRRELALSGRSAFGRYAARALTTAATPKLTTEDAQEIIRDLLAVLEKYGVLAVAVEPRDAEGLPGYRLKASALIWRAGDATVGADDPIRRTHAADVAPRVNPFFRDLYRDRAAQLAGLHAAEHTAQVTARDREDREAAFRKGDLPLLFCSPTMELGVDIASLNAVGLRNVPPTPANYAQRSGRAGRSGQPALVMTYCATGNSHDQYYFRRSDAMVAGAVAAPRLDLANEDLVRSHLHAIWLGETGVSLHSSLGDLLDLAGENPSLELLPEVRAELDDPHAKRRAVQRAQASLAEMESELRTSSWWDDTWIERVIDRAPITFDEAGNRWRNLYRGALAEQARQNKIVLDQSASKRDRDLAASRRRDAETQLHLLRNEDRDQLGQGDFYSYRYFASEGFLPGYSFPRLPLAAYIPGTRGLAGKGDYVQRPRFLAISEFGPGALIYHEGTRYQVTRVQLPRGKTEDAALDTEEARRCEECGYHHAKDANLDLCENCGGRLGPTTRNLLRLQTVFTRRRERISSDEEERRRAGFELLMSYRFNDHGTRPGRVDAEVRGSDGEPIASLTYGGTATVRVTNVGRRRRKQREDVGYWIDSIEGRWLSEKEAPDVTPGEDELDSFADTQRKQKVIPFVEDTRNILITRLDRRVEPDAAITLQYALERGIEAHFQLEDSELSSLALPDPDGRARTLFAESAEGGAGVLRRLLDEPQALATVARTALTIAHFDPDTGADMRRAPGAREDCEKACYDCLLSYTNQIDHPSINRHTVRDLLLALTDARTAVTDTGRSRAETAVRLRAQADSELERDFIAFLYDNDYRLPDEPQALVSSARARPDFVYRLQSGPTALFLDGPVHDTASVAERDAAAEERLMDLGWNVVRVSYDEDWHRAIRQHASVFGNGRER